MLPLSQDARIPYLAYDRAANTADDDYYQQSDGKRHLAPHAGVNLAIMNVPAFLALIKSDPRPEYLHEGRTMAHHAELNTRIHSLCEEANAMLLANLLDTKTVHVLRQRMLECAGHARDAGHADGENQLRRSEQQLRARFPPVND